MKQGREPTAYEQRVYKLCSAIPKGFVTTYGELAKALTPPSSARAVGQAMRRNPYAPKVPCHRVVASDLHLGGFAGSWGPECASVKRKHQMLQDEGVTFRDDDTISRQCVVRATGLQRLASERAAGGDVTRDDKTITDADIISNNNAIVGAGGRKSGRRGA